MRSYFIDFFTYCRCKRAQGMAFRTPELGCSCSLCCNLSGRLHSPWQLHTLCQLHTPCRLHTPCQLHTPWSLSFPCSHVRNSLGHDIVQSFGLDVRTSVPDFRNLFVRIGRTDRTCRICDDVWRRDLGNRRQSSRHRSRILGQICQNLCQTLCQILYQILRVRILLKGFKKIVNHFG